jgi:chaperonin cofactor prefoldin
MTDLANSLETIQARIHTIRGQRVMLDADLAKLYGVVTRRLNEQIRRNRRRFPEDFAFRLTAMEFENLKSQFATSSSGWGGRRKLPYVFTEHGVLMAANVLSSAIAVQSSIYVVRAFVALREALAIHKDLAEKVEALREQYQSHDKTIDAILAAIRELAGPTPISSGRQIGFVSND